MTLIRFSALCVACLTAVAAFSSTADVHGSSIATRTPQNSQEPSATSRAEPPSIAANPEARAALDPSWVGAWIGEARAPVVPGRPQIGLPVTIVVEAPTSAGGSPRIAMTVIPAGAVAKPAIDVVADGKAIGFTLDGGSARARFAALVSDDGRAASGSCMLFNEQGDSMPPALDLVLKRIDLVSQLREQKVYKATLDAAGQKLDMRLAIGEGKFGLAGAYEIAAQGLRDFAVLVTKTEKGYSVLIPVGTNVTLELASNADATVLDGTFTQGAFTAPIRFELEPGARLGALGRPQDPVAPFPYTERDVRITHPDGHALSGTLTIPADLSLARDGRLPAVVLVTGSGPQDRDEALMGHRPFLVIADALARAGVAVLRYDDRGVARSTGDYNAATTIDFASDADVAANWLKSQPEIDPTRVGIIGHSEGGLIAPIVALWQNEGDTPKNPLAFLVLLAGTAEEGGRLLTRQSKSLYDAAGVPSEKSAPALEAHAAVMAAVKAGKTGDVLRPFVEEMVRRQVAIGSDPVPDDATLKPTFDAAVAQVSSPWMIEFIRFNPRPTLSMIEIPTLALNGSKDVQVDMETNLGAMDEIATQSGAPIVTRRFEGLNHLFQPATTGVIDEYGTIETTFDPQALAAMVSWVVETSKRTPVPQIPEAKRPAGWKRPDAAQLPARPSPKPTSAETPVSGGTRRGAPALPTRPGGTP